MGVHDDLRRCIEGRTWTTLRGTFASRGQPPFRFVFRRPGDWRFESTVDDDVLATEGAEQLMGARADHAWLASGTSLIAASPNGRASIGADLWRLVQPERALLVPEHLQEALGDALPTSYDQLDVRPDVLNGHAVWSVGSGDDRIIVDQAHGVGVRHQRAKGDATMHDLDVDPDVPADCFSPPATGASSGRSRHGVAYISENPYLPEVSFTSSWEVRRSSGLGYFEAGPRHHTAAEAVAWGKQRAESVIIRTGDGTRYTAGETPPDGETLPPWPG